MTHHVSIVGQRKAGKVVLHLAEYPSCSRNTLVQYARHSRVKLAQAAAHLAANLRGPSSCYFYFVEYIGRMDMGAFMQDTLLPEASHACFVWQSFAMVIKKLT